MINTSGTYWTERLSIVFLTMAFYSASEFGVTTKTIIFFVMSFLAMLVYFTLIIKPQSLGSYLPNQETTPGVNKIMFILRKNVDDYCLYSTVGRILHTFERDQLDSLLELYRQNQYTTYRLCSESTGEEMIALVWAVKPPESTPEEEDDDPKDIPTFSA